MDNVRQNKDENKEYFLQKINSCHYMSLERQRSIDNIFHFLREKVSNDELSSDDLVSIISLIKDYQQRLIDDLRWIKEAKKKSLPSKGTRSKSAMADYSEASAIAHPPEENPPTGSSCCG